MTATGTINIPPIDSDGGRVTLQCDIGTVSIEELERQISPAWLTGALSQRYQGVEVLASSVERVLAGCAAKVFVRLTFNEAGKHSGLPATMVVKAGFNRHDPMMLFTYDIEMRAYRDVVPRFPINSPTCYYAGSSPDGTSAAIIIEDLTAKKVRFCHALTPLNYNEAAAFLDALAQFHALTWNHPALTDGSFDWAIKNAESLTRISTYYDNLTSQSSWADFMAQPRGAATPNFFKDRERFLEAFKRMNAYDRNLPQVIMMGDEHLGNLYIESDGTPGFFDFQSRIASWSQGISYFIGCALDILDRRKWERDLLAHYLSRLNTYGIAAPSFEEAWEAYTRDFLFGYVTWVANGTYFQTESVNTANTTRFVHAMIDNDTFGRLGVSV